MKSFKLEGLISYDAVYRRQRFVWKEKIGNQFQEIDRLFLEKQKVLYEFNVLTKKCSKIENFEWKDYSVPLTSTFLGSSYIGSSAVPNANILTNAWAWNSTDAKGNNIEIIGVWTDIGCIPIRIEGTGPEFGTARSNFYDITPGIKSKIMVKIK